MITKAHETAILKRLSTAARELFLSYGDDSEEIVYLSGLSSGVKEKLLEAVKAIRAEEETSAWNRGIAREA